MKHLPQYTTSFPWKMYSPRQNMSKQIHSQTLSWDATNPANDLFDSSLRTRLSTQRAALNLGMNVIVLDINQGAWKMETERGL